MRLIHLYQKNFKKESRFVEGDKTGYVGEKAYIPMKSGVNTKLELNSFNKKLKLIIELLTEVNPAKKS